MLVRTRFDQFGKQMVRAALLGRYIVETDAEVHSEARRIDLWFMPQQALPAPDYLGLLGRITAGPGTLEFFHNTPGGDELADCVIKHGSFRHALSLRDDPPPVPTQWVISSGRPGGGIDGLWLRSMQHWPSGVYEAAPLLYTRLVVVNELPVARDTLLLRMLGAGAVLRRAIAELRDLPEDAPERSLALPILVRLRLDVPTNPVKQTKDDQEFLVETEDVVEKWHREAVDQGVQQGLHQGIQQGTQQTERAILLHQMRSRFGSQVNDAIEQRVTAAPSRQIYAWLERILSATSLTELLTD